jgi:hypothetical protein
LKPGAWIEVDKYVKQIADAGYQARRDDIRLTVTGMVTKEGDKLLLTVDDVKPEAQTLALSAASSKDRAEAERFASELRSAADKLGKRVEVVGWWKAPD